MLSPLIRLSLVANFIAIGLLTAGLPFVAAAEPELLFEDSFSAVDGSFSSSEHIKYSTENGTLLVAADADWWTKPLYQSGIFEDIDYTVRVQLADPDAGKDAYIGLVFWAQDYENYTFFAISDTGNISVFNAKGQQMTSPLSWRAFSSLKTGSDEWNELRVITVGSRATIFLNGKKVTSFKGRPPQGGSLIGLIYSAGKESSVGRFQSLKVVTPSGPESTPPASDSDPDIILADDFSTLDPAWGSESGNLSVKDGTLVIKPDLGYINRYFYQAMTVADVDASVKVRVSDTDSESYSTVSLLFWAAANDDYFMFDLDDRGQIGVSRFLKGRWLTPLAYKKLPVEAMFDPTALTELRVVTNGKKATLSVNGFAVGTLVNPQLKGDWQFGLGGQSGAKSQSVCEFQSLSVRNPAAGK